MVTDDSTAFPALLAPARLVNRTLPPAPAGHPEIPAESGLKQETIAATSEGSLSSQHSEREKLRGGDMRRSMLALGLAIPLFTPVDASAATCMPFVRTFHGQTVDAQMTVRSGKRCNITFRSLGPTETTHIVQRSSNGTVSVSGDGRVTYQARSGFTGSDIFVYARRGRDMQDNRSDRQVRVLVTVNP
jgi:hypothetical protein